MTYYVDAGCKIAGNDGLTKENPLPSIDKIKLNAGDTVLFKRETVIKTPLFLQSGESGKPITYGAYGEGENPVVNTSVQACNSKQWHEEYPNIWRFTGELPSEICNIVFDDGICFGNLRWEMESLKKQGEWTCDTLGYSMRKLPHNGNGTLYLFSKKNPAKIYNSIELVFWGEMKIVTAQHDVIIENITFEKGGVHGFAATNPERIHIINCRFRCIGGGIFDLENKIRLGNAVEFWNGARDCLVERCTFEDIYDSGVTHQGNSCERIPKRIIFRQNTFIRCGLAAYEWRGPVSKDIIFEKNRCMEAGGAFTLQGEGNPRRTEKIENISACVFVLIWYKEEDLAENAVYCTIRNNQFYLGSGSNAAIWSTLKKKDYRHFIIDHNEYYQQPAQAMTHIDDRTYVAEEYRRYQEETKLDKSSNFIILNE